MTSRLDIYEQLRMAHNYIKNVGGMVYDHNGKDVVMRKAMVNEVKDLSKSEIKKTSKLLDRITDDLYALEEIYGKQ